MHHYQSLGGWTFSFQDYWHLNLTQYLTDPEFQAMADNIDPYSKFIIDVISFEKQKPFLFDFTTLFLIYDQATISEPRTTLFWTSENTLNSFKAIIFLFC